MPVPPMTSDQEELISALVHYQEEFEQPSEADIKRIQVSGDFTQARWSGLLKDFPMVDIYTFMFMKRKENIPCM